MQRATSWPKPVQAKFPLGTPVEVWDGVAGGKYHLINTIPLWEEFFPLLNEQMSVACDTETTSLSYIDGKIIGFSFSWGAEDSYYVPVRHETNEKQLDIEVIRPDLQTFFRNPDRRTIWHNFKFDGHFLIEEDMAPTGIVHDTRLMVSLADENLPGALKKLANLFVDKNADKWEDMVDQYRAWYGRRNKIAKKKVHYGFVPLPIMTPYAASDAHYDWRIFKKFLSKITSDNALTELYLLESQLLWVLLAIEHNGVFVDKQYLEDVGPELEEEAFVLRKAIQDKLGDGVNPDSNKELVQAFQRVGVKLYKKTKSDKTYSLDAEVMEKLASRYEVCQEILDYRGLKKKKTTYVDSILEKLDMQMRLHCEYNQILVTGRMSSKKPNLQNIPGKDTAIRKAFIAPHHVHCIDCQYMDKHLIIPAYCPDCGGNLIDTEAYVLAYIDYSQMEIRMTAHYSEDPILLAVYGKANENVHLRTMCEIFGWDYKEADEARDDENHRKHKEAKAQYKIAKMINFLIIYGGSAKTLAARISTPKKQYTEKQCKVFMNSYFKRYKGVRRWISMEKLYIRKHGEGQNHFGRYRRFPDLHKWIAKEHLRDYKWRIERAERQWVNYLIQGSCADLFKIAMVRVHELLKGKKTQMVMPIHDELVFYLHVDELNLLKPIREAMEDFKFRIPMTVDISYSETNWADKKELKLELAT